ncbi:4433_t:CDS:2 [Cetraspora pellucida]|uniref:4433_t:CDS:1 n=1 Tax=Cetraspora pellucida TaxID=1433469 RepID=A0A9N9E8A1_9GLOM|nr:4433_t:CDS:2 [Cetraspora pellucida]
MTINTFEDKFIIQQKSTYVDKDHLALLTKKAEEQSEKIAYKLASLNITVDKKQMLLGFSSKHLSTYNNKLDKSKSNLKEFIDTDEESSQNQKILNEDNILEVLQKDKQALPRAKQAYSTILEKFLNANITNI